MPSDSSERVAADYSATPETPVEGANALGEAEGVEKFNPPTAEPGAAASRNWADLSEDILSPVLSFGEAPTSADRAPRTSDRREGRATSGDIKLGCCAFNIFLA